MMEGAMSDTEDPSSPPRFEFPKTVNLGQQNYEAKQARAAEFTAYSLGRIEMHLARLVELLEQKQGTTG